MNLEDTKTQWIFFGLEQGGYGNRYHITEQMTEEEFLKKYGICVSIIGYFPICKINMEEVSSSSKFFKK